ncbi:MAG: Fe-S cluster assembly sulfur transfer protein SufU [Actinomycetes bacterium]
MSADALYQEIILDHYRRPHHKGLRAPYDIEVHHTNPTCGDEITLRVRLRGSGDETVVEDVSYDGDGCSISQASTSIMADLLVGATVAEGLEVEAEFHRLMLGLGQVAPDVDRLADAVALAGVARYPARVKCALLGWLAWKDAVVQVLGTRPATGEPTP